MAPTLDCELSVIIPAFRAENTIGRAVSSVLEQSLAPDEIVIASDDGTDYRELLRGAGIGDARIRCVPTGAVRSGAAAARNAALDGARGRIIATLDADDLLAPDALQTLAPLAERHGAAFCRPKFIDEATGAELESLDRRLNPGLVGLEDILTGQIHTYAGIVFDREKVSARWPEWMERWEDVYFYVRCFDDVDAIFHVPHPLYHYHRIPGSICNRPETGEEYLAWAEELLSRLDRGDPLGLKNPHSRLLFRRFLLSRRAIEASFVQALSSGACRDFHSFTRSHLDLFYRLAPDAPAAAPA
jgi:glycosyltransferase involved in cell wall biosynthesis